MFYINHRQWKIVFVPPHHSMLMRSDGIFTIGVCDNLKRTIFINENLRGNFLKKVLCHEIAHAAMFSYNIILDIKEEEQFCDLIANYGNEIISTTNRVFKKLRERY